VIHNWCIAINNWIKFPTFYQSMDQISPRRDKKLGPVPLNGIIEGATGDTSQFEVYFAVNEK